MRKLKFKKLLAVLLITLLLFSQLVFADANNNTQSFNSDFIKSIVDMIKSTYNGDVTDNQLLQGIMKGVFGTMDPYTVFYTPDEAKAFLNDIGGTIQGIGVVISKEGDYITVDKVIPGSPAERAGITTGDRIVKVDGKSILGITADQAAKLITGQAGTKVSLDIIKIGRNNSISITLGRENVSYNPVTYEIKDGIGYLKLEIFNSNAYAGVKTALDAFDKAGIKKVVLDLRDNPGGEVDQAVAIAREFIPKGLITSLRFKSDKLQDIDYYSYLETPRYKLSVLVNGNSASASEIFAGAVQDTAAGTLIGTKTFGKAKVQNLFPILTPEAYEKYESQLGVKIVNVYDLYGYGIIPTDDEILGWVKMTTGMYTTPKGRMIDLVGINPDIQVKDPTPANGIDVKSIQKLTAANKFKLNDNSTDIYNAERIMKALGYFSGTPGYTLDKNASAAVSKFQKAVGGYPYGVLDLTTQRQLNKKLEELNRKTDMQYSKAVEILNK
ncbi:MAG: S41 family peptidase [Bacillota bacterium]|nr:S41 family peptidase [Bacillota bacterium]